MEKLRSQMDLNFWGAAEMAHGILNEWLAPDALEKRGSQKHLIFTSTVCAFYAPAGYAPYAPAKAALRNLSDTLQQEMLLYGGGDAVKVHTVCPGTITSPGFENEQKTKPDITKELEESDPVQTPEEVAAASIKGLEAGEYLITVNWLGRALKSQAWGGMPRSNWFLDTIFTFITSFVWMIMQPMLDGQVRAHGKKHGHPSTYLKKA
jgi:3-dehydrosphinganine reductase